MTLKPKPRDVEKNSRRLVLEAKDENVTKKKFEMFFSEAVLLKKERKKISSH